ncbi:MAG: DUF6020 family protein [Lachnospiraceae bacterium]|nr:DUF6020 family protein [Lachnospiraceae bacterium]
MYLFAKILLTVYLYLISYFYTLSVPASWDAPLRFAAIYVCVHVICHFLQKLRVTILDEPGHLNWRFGLVSAALAWAVLGIYYAAWYPGGLIVDTFNQWYQVQQGYLLDWHPAIHTLLFLKLPSLICNSLAFACFMQIVWLGLAVGYLGMVLERWGIPKKWCILALALGVIAPASAICLSFIWKDTAMTIFLIVLAGQVIEIVFSDGAWLKKWQNTVLFGLFGALAALMRHNAILLVAPLMLLIALLYWKQLKRCALMGGICTLVFIAGIKGPVYKILHVQSHPQVAAEMLGVPMTILANVLVNAPEKLDEEAREFLYRIADQEMWESNYEEGNWNSAKWMGDDISNDVIEEVGAGNVLRYTWHAIQKAPYLSYRAVVKLFEVVWKPAGTSVTWSYTINVDSSNIYGYETTGIAWLRNILSKWDSLAVNGSVLTTWSWHIGFFIMLLLFFGVSRLKEGLKKTLLWVPALCYNFGTALLLCGPDFRFFCFNTVLSFVLVLALLCQKREAVDEKAA